MIPTILSQQEAITELLQLFACYSQQLILPEHNYTIWDWEILVIKASFKVWQHHLDGTQHLVQVWMDHCNLKHMQTACQLNRYSGPFSLPGSISLWHTSPAIRTSGQIPTPENKMYCLPDQGTTFGYRSSTPNLCRHNSNFLVQTLDIGTATKWTLSTEEASEPPRPLAEYCGRLHGVVGDPYPSGLDLCTTWTFAYGYCISLIMTHQWGILDGTRLHLYRPERFGGPTYG